MSAPTIDEFKKAQLELFGWFSFRHYGKPQQFLLATAESEFRIFIEGPGLPMHFDHPGPIADATDARMLLPKHLRARPGFVLTEKRKVGHRVGFDLPFDTIVAYNEHNQLCWRSAPITKIMSIVEI